MTVGVVKIDRGILIEEPMTTKVYVPFWDFGVAWDVEGDQKSWLMSRG